MKSFVINRKIYITIFMIIIVMLGVGCSSPVREQTKLKVAVSIEPEAAFVKAVAGDLVNVVTLIPAGASPTNYQPSPKEMSDFQDSKAYFTIGVPTETANILPNIVSNNSAVQLVYLDDIVSEVYPSRYFDGEDEAHTQDQTQEEHTDDHDHQGRDPHIWMSPKRVIIMVDAIKDTLIELDPDNKETYNENAQSFIKEIDVIDKQIAELSNQLTNKTFIIMHPSLGYLADDYGLVMVSLEQNGKESTASHLQEVIQFANDENIKVVFYQTEFDSSQAKTLASEIDGKVMALDILSFDYLDNMKHIIEVFSQELDQ